MCHHQQLDYSVTLVQLDKHLKGTENPTGLTANIANNDHPCSLYSYRKLTFLGAVKKILLSGGVGGWRRSWPLRKSVIKKKSGSYVLN